MTFMEVISAKPTDNGKHKKWSVPGSREGEGGVLHPLAYNTEKATLPAYIAEGYATAMSIAISLHRDEYGVVVAARGAGGLVKVARRVKSGKHSTIIICADAGAEDTAREAAASIGGLVATTGSDVDGYDFNDLYREQGAIAVAERLRNGALERPSPIELGIDITPHSDNIQYSNSVYKMLSNKRMTGDEVAAYIDEWNTIKRTKGNEPAHIIAEMAASRYGKRISQTPEGRWFVYKRDRWTCGTKDDARALLMQCHAVHERRDENTGEIRASLVGVKPHTLGPALIHYGQHARMEAILDDPRAVATLLNTPDATIEINTGKHRRHNPDDYITKITTITPADTPTPFYDKFMSDFTCWDGGMRSEIESALGAACVGNTRHEKFYIFLGATRKGKSTLTELISYVLGDSYEHAGYATTVNSALLLPTWKQQSNIDEQLANIEGARAILVNDPPANAMTRSDLLKQLTGGDAITSRHLYKDRRAFRCTGQIFIATNYEPKLTEVSDAMLRRVRIVPCEMQVDEIDPLMKDRLRDEAAGILYKWIGHARKWINNACQYNESGTITEATRKYERNQDELGEAISACFEDGDNALTITKMKAKQIVYAYLLEHGDYSNDVQVQRRYKTRDIDNAMARLGYVEHKTNSVRLWRGIRLTADGDAIAMTHSI